MCLTGGGVAASDREGGSGSLLNDFCLSHIPLSHIPVGCLWPAIPLASEALTSHLSRCCCPQVLWCSFGKSTTPCTVGADRCAGVESFSTRFLTIFRSLGCSSSSIALNLLAAIVRRHSGGRCSLFQTLCAIPLRHKDRSRSAFLWCFSTPHPRVGVLFNT